MNPIDGEVKDAMRARAQAAEDAGEVVNRRALAREFGVSPQTVARALDGPDARRGYVHSMNGDERTHLGPALFGAAVVAYLVYLWRRLR